MKDEQFLNKSEKKVHSLLPFFFLHYIKKDIWKVSLDMASLL